MIKILFMGTPDFAVPALEKLIETQTVVCVVSQPDRPRGRGHKLAPTATKEVALRHDIPVEQPVKLKDGAFLPILEKYAPDMIVVAAYGRLLPDYILEYPKHGCINIHGSLLPKYRGAAPIQWAVLNGEKKTGVTIMHMAHDMDAGDIICCKETDILPNETSGELFDRLSVLGAQALSEVIEDIYDGRAPRTPQRHESATYAPMISKEMAALDFTMPAEKIARTVRGLNPWPIAYIKIKSVPVKVFCARCGGAVSAPAGTVLAVDRDGITVATADGAIILERLQKPDKKPVDAYAFAQGEHVRVGDIL